MAANIPARNEDAQLPGPIPIQGNLDAVRDEDQHQAPTTKNEDQNRSGDIRMAEDKYKVEQKCLNIQNKVDAEDRQGFGHKDQIPTNMEANKCLLWVTKQDERSQLDAIRSLNRFVFLDLGAILFSPC